MAPEVIPWTPTTTWLLESFNSELSQAGTYNTAKHSHPKTFAYSKSVLTD